MGSDPTGTSQKGWKSREIFCFLLLWVWWCRLAHIHWRTRKFHWTNFWLEVYDRMCGSWDPLWMVWIDSFVKTSGWVTWIYFRDGTFSFSRKRNSKQGLSCFWMSCRKSVPQGHVCEERVTFGFQTLSLWSEWPAIFSLFLIFSTCFSLSFQQTVALLFEAFMTKWNILAFLAEMEQNWLVPSYSEFCAMVIPFSIILHGSFLFPRSWLLSKRWCDQRSHGPLSALAHIFLDKY